MLFAINHDRKILAQIKDNGFQVSYKRRRGRLDRSQTSSVSTHDVQLEARRQESRKAKCWEVEKPGNSEPVISIRFSSFALRLAPLPFYLSPSTLSPELSAMSLHHPAPRTPQPATRNAEMDQVSNFMFPS
jgi:hypothetical protein